MTDREQLHHAERQAEDRKAKDHFWNWVLMVAATCLVVGSIAFGWSFARQAQAMMSEASLSQIEVNAQLANALQVSGAVTSGPGGALLFDADGKITHLTVGIERITGWSLTQIREDGTKIVLVPDIVAGYLTDHSVLGVGERLRMGPEAGIKLKTRSGELVPVSVDIWRYDWQQERRLAVFVMPAHEIKSAEKIIPADILDTLQQTGEDMTPAMKVLK